MSVRRRIQSWSVMSTMGQGAPEELAVHNLLRAIVEISGSAHGCLVRRDGDIVERLAEIGGPERRRRAARGAPAASADIPLEAVRRVTLTKKSIYYRGAPTAAKRAALVNGKARASSLCVPVLSRKVVIGVLCLNRRESAAALTTHQRRVIGLLLEQTALTIDLAERCRRELQAFQARINSPFLHNAFSVIAEMVVADPTRAEAAIVKLSRFFRYILESSSDQIVTLAQELGITREYLTLEQLRLGDRMEVEIRAKGPLDQVHVPALVLQGLAECTIRSGVARRMGTVRLEVEVIVTPWRCRLRVRDASLGGADHEIRRDATFADVKRRLSRFYPGTHALRIGTSRGTSLEVTIPRDGLRSQTGARSAAPSSPSILFLQRAGERKINQATEGNDGIIKRVRTAANK